MGKIRAKVDSDLKAFIPGYLANRSSELAVIETCLEQGDFASIKRLAHRMKGSGGGYGFDGITAIGAEMEQAAAADDAVQVRQQAAALQDYLNRLEIIYV